MSDTPKEPKVQTYNLKDDETQTLAILQTNHQRGFAAVLSMITQGRMGYKVTERTQFKLNADFTEIEISEIPEDVPVASAPEAPKAPDAPSTGAVPAK